MSQLSPSLFHGRHFDHAVILLCVRWYITYKLSYRDLVEMMAERGVDLAHTTILRWVQRYVPELERRWQRYAQPIGFSWRVDETYIKVRGQWTYLYRAVDKQGRTVDFMLSKRRDTVAAKRFFNKAIKRHGFPDKITLDGYEASHQAVTDLQKEEILPNYTQVRTSKYINNLIEQDHRRIKQRIYPMLGFKRVANAAITLSGIELAHKIKKGQFDVLRESPAAARTPQVWEAVIAA